MDDLKLLIINLSAEVNRLGEKMDARLLNIEQKMEVWERRMTGIETSMASCKDALATNTRIISHNTLKIRNLEERAEALERRARENNLIIYGIESAETDSRELLLQKVKKLMAEDMQITDDVVIAECHRLGRGPKAPILIEVPDHESRISLLKNSFKLRMLNIFMSRDYSPQIREQRKILIEKRKELYRKGIGSKLRDNKLLLNGINYMVVEGQVPAEPCSLHYIDVGTSVYWSNQPTTVHPRVPALSTYAQTLKNSVNHVKIASDNLSFEAIRAKIAKTPQLKSCDVTAVTGKDKKLVLHFPNSAESKRFVDGFKTANIDGLKVLPNPTFRPRLAIFGIPVEKSESDLVSDLMENPVIAPQLINNSGGLKLVKLIRKEGSPSTAIIEVNKGIEEALLARGRVTVDFLSLRLAQAKRVFPCGICGCLSHRTHTDGKKCTNAPKCANCAGAHFTTACENKSALKCHSVNVVFVMCELSGKSILLCNVYLPPSCDPSPLLDKINYSLNSLNYDEVIFCGDLNVESFRWSDKPLLLRHHSPKRDLVENFIDANYLHVLNTHGAVTWEEGNRSSSIDVTCCSAGLVNSVTDWHPEYQELSDHKRLVFNLNFAPSSQDNTRFKLNKFSEIYFSFGRADWDRVFEHFSQKIENINIFLENVRDSSSLDDVINLLGEEIFHTCLNTIPSRPRSDKYLKSISWWKSDLNPLKRATQKAQRAFIKARGVVKGVLEVFYKRLKAKYRRARRLAKKEAWRAACSRCEISPWGGIYSFIKGNFNRKPLSALPVGSGFTEGPRDTLNHVLDYYFGRVPPDTMLEHKDLSKVIASSSDNDPLFTDNELLLTADKGSVLGPFLWNIVFDELLTLDYRNNVFPQAYADDLVVVVSGCRPSQLPAAQHTIDMIARWCSLHKLELSVGKCQAMVLLRPHGRLPEPRRDLVIHGRPIQWCDSIKVLGVRFDQRLSFYQHVVEVCAKVRGMLPRLTAAANLNFGFGYRALRTLYLQVVVPAIAYASAAEALGLVKALENATTLPNHLTLGFFLDNLSVVKSVLNSKTGNYLIDRALLLISRLNRNGNRCTIQWIKGHSGNVGNDIADTLAKRGAESAKPSCYKLAPLSFVKSAIYGRAREAWESRFLSLAPSIHTRFGLTPMNLLDKRYAYIVPSEHIVVGLLSGHTWTDSFAHRIGVIDDPSCPYCDADKEETLSHIVLECSSLDALRFPLLSTCAEELGYTPRSLKDFIFNRSTWRACLEFLKASDRLKPRVRAEDSDHPSDSDSSPHG
ncbi:hypothetical protein LAZ67_5002375 [Cordylochernes scorpioides]|uniref:RNase H type-1 domain-containing protein n=1 Tax=Cordylochernes scorpioides TaxID=51811 RepID=A0ABY6KGB4_9ARAC|nr:hypothetical protein LAZ67_5002375 [Cordylochernes scorpioides]